mmetsp:Transcript_18961/g.54993  ORF Transcript_18961/g.54993 Transcript_18961/m.54993 type:complete len:349 (+) Transcript_18961:613-1659(+)
MNWSAEAPKTPEHLYADAVAHCLCLLHRMGRDDDGLRLCAHLDSLPQEPLRTSIHCSRRLVQEEHVAGPDKGEGERQLPFHSPAVRPRGLIRVLRLEAEALEEAIDDPVELVARDALHPAVEEEVLAPGEVPEQGVDLRAEPEVLERQLRAGPRDGVPRHVHLAGGWRLNLAGQAPKRGRLAGAVRPQQPEALATLHAQGDAAHGVHGARLVVEDVLEVPVHAGLPVGGCVANSRLLLLDVLIRLCCLWSDVARVHLLLLHRGQTVGDHREDDAQASLPDPRRPEHPGAREPIQTCVVRHAEALVRVRVVLIDVDALVSVSPARLPDTNKHSRKQVVRAQERASCVDH